jgi:hypothetical protein
VGGVSVAAALTARGMASEEGVTARLAPRIDALEGSRDGDSEPQAERND